MRERRILYLLILILSISFISAVAIGEDLHLNIQTTNSTGVVTGTFRFDFNISASADCANVVYTNYTSLTTDSRGIVSYYLENVVLNFSEQYWLCYYRDLTLINTSKIARTPYTYRARNISIGGVEFNENVNTGIYNMTSSWFFGLYNWITGLIGEGSSNNYLIFNGSTLSFNETILNDTIDLKTMSTTYNASLISTVLGTLDDGNISSIQYFEDGYTYNVSETAGANAFMVYVNFTNINTFDEIIMREMYSGGLGHEVAIQLWDYSTSTWETYSEITDQNSFVYSVINVLDPVEHIQNGVFQLRFDHVQNGIGTHDFFLDYIALVDGFTTLTNAEHDSLGGRDDVENHPWALDKNGSRPLTANWQIGNFNITNISQLGIGTTNPNQALHVVGNVNITGNMTVANSSFYYNGSCTIIKGPTTTIELC